jgi:hypothetical protein
MFSGQKVGQSPTFSHNTPLYTTHYTTKSHIWLVLFTQPSHILSLLRQVDMYYVNKMDRDRI